MYKHMHVGYANEYCPDCAIESGYYDKESPPIESIKQDQDKVDPTMLTWEMVEAVSRVRMFGAKKYGRDNFKRTGFKYTRSLAAVLRHVFSILNGEWLDKESGLPHAAHAICGLEHLIYDSIHHPENNDIKTKTETDLSSMQLRLDGTDTDKK